jgi:hypothetical protein
MKNFKIKLFFPMVLLLLPSTVFGTSGKEAAYLLESRAVAVGGPVKGLFEPTITPLTWTDISESGGMGTENFTYGQSTDMERANLEWGLKIPGISDIERANFERGMKLPSFNVPSSGCGDVCPAR